MIWSWGKVTVALAAVALALTVAGVSFAMRPTTPGYTPPPDLQQALDRAHAEQVAAATPTTALFVGDSYTAGGGGIDSDQTFAAVFCREWNWMCWRDAQGGTGYVATGMNNSPTFTAFQGRIVAAKEGLQGYKDPMYVVVAGGRNDYGLRGLARAADEYLAAVRRIFPTSRLIVVLPFWQTDPADPVVSRMRRQIKAAAVRHGADWVGTAGWLRPSLMGEDGVHPTVEGHRRIAHRLQEWMAEHGARSRAGDEQTTDVDIVDTVDRAPQP